MIEQDLTGEGNSQKVAKDITNISGRLSHVKSQLDVQNKTLEKAKELRVKAVEGAIQDFKKAYPEQVNKYHEEVERKIYSHLEEVREKQVELLRQLLASRKQFVNELQQFDFLCEDNGLTGYKIEATMAQFENNLYMPNR